MHSMGLHSALAIKRQRKRRADQKRAKERRFSIQSTESGLGIAGSHSSCASPRNSIDGTEHGHRHRRRRHPDKSNSFDSNVGIGMLHIGVVFVVLGIFLLGSGLIPKDIDKWEWQDIFTRKAWWNELVLTGAFALALGIFLIVLDKFITRREEEDLNEYVQRQLTRSKSGHRLVRDVETGNLTTKHRSKSSNPITEETKSETIDELPNVHSPVVKTPPANYTASNHAFMNGDASLLSPQLEKILEEDTSEKYEDEYRNAGNHEEYDSTTASVSPGTPSETQELLNGAPAYTSSIKVHVPSKYHQVRMSKI